MRSQSSAIESSTKCNERSVNSLSPNDAYQNISLIEASDQPGPSSTLQNQINDLGARDDHVLHSSFTKEQNHVGDVPNLIEGIQGSTGNLISDVDNSNQGPNLSAGYAEDNSDLTEPEFCHSVGVPGISDQQDRISSGSNACISGPSERRREVQGGLRQTFEAGSSRGPQQTENSLSNNMSVHLNASSSHTISTSPSSLSHANSQENPIQRSRAGVHANPNTHPHPSTSFHAERPQGNFNLGLQNYRSQSDFSSSQPLLSMGRNGVFVGPNTPNMSRMVLVPSGSRNPLQSPLTINSNLRAGTVNERRPYSLADGRYGFPYNHQMEYGSGLHQLPLVPMVIYNSFNQMGTPQTALGYPTSFSSPWNGHGLRAGNLDVAPRPYPATYGNMSLADITLQSGNNPGQNPYVSGPLITHSGHQVSRLGMPHTLQSVEAEIQRRHRMMSEGQVGSINSLQRALVPRARSQIAHNNAIVEARSSRAHDAGRVGYPVGSRMHDRHRDMRLDVDNMSYEELVTLGERIGNVQTGLREEAIMELLRRRHYECIINDPSFDAETCCICREEYVSGEEVGALNCGHEFHTSCIKQWLIVKNKCPICMKKGLGT